MSDTSIKSRLQEYVEKIEGYRISSSHFKLGEEFHAEDFFYAKRLFQNSYYVSRIAVLIARDLKRRIDDKKIEELTLVGYEMYSMPLLSSIQKFLEDIFSVNLVEFNHIAVCKPESPADGIEMKHFPPLEKEEIHKYCAIIMPIISTGRTATAVREFVLKYCKKEIDFLYDEESYKGAMNVLAVDDPEKLKTQDTTTRNNPLLHLKTKWHPASECPMCFINEKSSDNHASSQLRPLFEMDQTALNPITIFGMPQTKSLSNKTKNASFNTIKDIFRNSILYKKVRRNNEFFLYSIDIEKTIQNSQNLKKNDANNIECWLDGVKKKVLTNTASRKIIIAPCHYSNSRFIDLVNKRIFASSATVLYYKRDQDYSLNFKLLYEEYIEKEKNIEKKENTEIFFVDDSLITGRTFFEIYDLLRFISEYKVQLRGIILITNQTTLDILTRIQRIVGNDRIFAFVNLNLPQLPRVSGINPLEKEFIRYQSLSKTSLHDVLRMNYNRESEDLNPKISELETSEENDKVNPVNDSTFPQKIDPFLLFETTHQLYQYFNIKIQEFKNKIKSKATNKTGLTNIKVKLKDIDLTTTPSCKEILKICKYTNTDLGLKKEKIEAIEKFIQHPFLLTLKVCEDAAFSPSENKRAVMKVLSQHTFLLYMPIRKATFSWYKGWFTETIKFLHPKKSYEIEDIQTIEDFAFLIRRAVFLGNYLPLSSECFEIIAKIFQQYGRHPESDSYAITKKSGLTKKSSLSTNQGTLHMTSGKSKKSFDNILEELQLFLLKQYVELAHLNRHCTEKIVIQLENFKSSFEATNLGKQFYRMLHRELASILKIDELWLKKSPGITSKGIKKLRIDRLLYAKYFKKNEHKILMKLTLKYVRIKKLIIDDIQDDIQDNAKIIADKLKNLFETPEKIGTFWVVTDNQKKNHVIHDESWNGRTVFDTQIKEDGLIYNFLEGEEGLHKSSIKTIIEYVSSSQNVNEWMDKYAIKENVFYSKNYLSQSNWLLLIRVSNPNDPKNTLGLLGFHSKDETYIDNNAYAKQMLMLLRDDIGMYILKHHKNDEFTRLLTEQAQKRFMSLAGHGKSMMELLKDNDPTQNRLFRNVASTMGRLQQLIATYDMESATEQKQKADKTNSKTMEEKFLELIEEDFLFSKIDKKFWEDVKEMGKAIYASEYIENSVDANFDCTPQTDHIEDPLFNFPKEILLFICFELLVNSKKNRYHFLKSYKYTCDCYDSKNKFNTTFKVNENVLSVIVSGPGLQVDKELVDRINAEMPVKDSNAQSGIRLIQKIIRLFNKKNKLTMQTSDTPNVCNKCGMCTNTVQLTIHGK